MTVQINDTIVHCIPLGNLNIKVWGIIRNRFDLPY